MQYLMSRYGGHGVIIGKGKASDDIPIGALQCFVCM